MVGFANTGSSCVGAFSGASRVPAYSLCVPAFLGRFMAGVDLSDHASFWDEGYPAVMITDTSFYRNPHYHSPDDTIDTLDGDFMVGVVEGLTESVRALAAEG